MTILAPGTLVGKYPVVRVMSSGGMGMIYEAVHPVLLTRVVIKTVLPALAGEESIAERFRNEALAASRIRDDRLPQILDIDRLEDGTQYMVMEYLDGEDLQRRLAVATLGMGYGVRIIFEILEVLHKVHQLGIIHRDITPRNIFLARSDLLGEIPKLLDFGVAHFVDGPSSQTGEVLGSPFYMAPEQIHAHCEIGPWTDVFAAGVVLYEILSGTGERPWPADSLVDYLTAIATRKRPRDLGAVAPDVPRELCDAVMRAIRVDAGARYVDAASFAQAIEPFAASRVTLYNAKRPADSSRTSIRPLSAMPDSPTVIQPPTQPAVLATGVTVAVPTSSLRGPMSSRPPAATLTGIQSQLAGMLKKPAQAPLRPRLREGERRHLTVLCLGMQLEGPPLGALDGEDADQLIRQITSLLERQIEGLGGRVMPPHDGSLMATFGHEQASEEDTEHAVSAALSLLEQRKEINDTLSQIAYTLHLRAGVHSGFVTRERTSGRDEAITGATLAAAKLLEHEAPPNGILVSREALDLLGGRFTERPFRKLSLKARLDPLEAFEIKGAVGSEVQRWSRGGVAETFGFVGRGEAISALRRVYDRALAHAASITPPLPGAATAGPPPIELCVVSGGAGVGKSRLLHELVEQIGEDPGGHVRVFRAQPASAAPYSLWVALLERVLLLPGGGRREATLVSDQLANLAVGLGPTRRSDLLSQSSVVAFLLSASGHDLDDPIAPADQKARIQQTIALILDAIAAPIPPLCPAIVVLDNVQRADAASVEILGKVLGGMRSATPPVIFLGVRDADLPLKLPENVNLTRVALEPLSRSEVAAMAAGIAGHEISPDATRLVLQRAGGNPLFIEEIVLALGDQGMTRADAATLRTFTVPTSLFGLILSRIDRLEPDLRAALQVASVLGVDFTTTEFDAVVSALDDSQASRRQLLELERRGLLERREAPEEAFAFRQVLVRDAVYTTVLRDNKRVLHQLAGAAIERLYAGYLDAHLPALFHHYSQTDEIERIVRYARLTGRRALALGAFDDAALALAMAETLRGKADEPDALPAARALFELGTALFWLGRLREARGRAEESEKLLDGDDREAALTLRARADLLISEIDYQGAHFSDAIAHLEAAEALFLRASLPFDAAQARCTRGFQRRAQGRLEEGLALAREGWEILRGSNALSAVVRAGHDLGNILRDVGDYAAAIEVFDRAIEAGMELTRTGNTPAAVWGNLAARSGRAMTLAAMGRLDEAIAAQREVYALAVEEHNPLAQVSAGFHLAQHLFDKGDLDAAEQAAVRALHLCSSLGMPARESKCRALMADIAARRAMDD